ncbi:hypothetical protein ACQW02_01785 [Humitalea sp. 24SJ18S-53]|uniref:hypothetical protein n=1 Tax=Humitalea sp. 24SJ18S-53 TaxID=3422307 RepID=UPI003D667D22
MGLWARLFGRAAPPPEPVAPPPDSTGKLIGQSLLRLEINTILKSNMTGEPMPPLPIALLDIAEEYCSKLESFGLSQVELARGLFAEDPDTPRSSLEIREQLSPTFDRFIAIRGLARTLLQRKEQARLASPGREGTIAATLPSVDEVTTSRMVQNCEIILDIIKRLPRDGLLWGHLRLTRAQLQGDDRGGASPLRLGPYDISPTQLMRLRKVWDVGTEEIVAQTSISLSGDVLMRVSPLLMTPEYRGLLDIHRDAVSMSTGYWRDLMNAAVTLATVAAGALLGSSKR